jgi:hypothetical protein
MGRRLRFPLSGRCSKGCEVNAVRAVNVLRAAAFRVLRDAAFNVLRAAAVRVATGGRARVKAPATAGVPESVGWRSPGTA